VSATAAERRVTGLQLAVALPVTAWILFDLVTGAQDVGPEVLLWIVVIAAVDLLPVPSTAGLDLTISLPLILSATILYRPGVAALITLAGSFDMRELRGEVSWPRAWFNRAQMALAIALAGACFHALATPASALAVVVPSLLLSATIAYVVNTTAVATMMAYASRTSLLTVVRRMHGAAPYEFLASYLGLGLLSPVIVHLATRDGLWLVVVVVGFIVTARQLYFRSRALADRLSEQNSVLAEQAGQLELLLEEVSGTEQRFRALVHNASDVVVVIDGGGVATYQTPSAERLLGVPAGELVGTRLEELVHPGQQAEMLEFLAVAMATPGVTRPVEWRLRHRDGSWHWMEAIGNNLLGDPLVNGVVFTIRSTMERRELHDRLRHQAFHDALTGLANRELFRDRVGHVLRRRRPAGDPVAVLFVDLDDFKVVNDSLGHEAGDHLLKAVAERITACLRPGDTAARLGGDEFAVLLDDADGEAGAIVVAERILDLLRLPVLLERPSITGTGRTVDRELFVHASIGIAVGAPGATAEELLRNADLAMYAAKARGKGCFETYRPSLHTATMERLQLKADLQLAVERRQLRLVYQPIVSIQDARTTGFEALLRWDHPELGAISPVRFIPLAEESGLIVHIGRWVLEQACLQAAAWQRLWPSRELTMSVNVSGRQFHEDDLVAVIRRVLERTGLCPSSLVLELTEGLLLDDTTATIAKLHQLREIGVRVAIDDFGTGYSSLSYLRRFPVDMLKIDKSFVDSLGVGLDDSALARAVFELGQTLRLKTVAEGVEAASQLDVLRAIKADFGQGFHIARPLTPAAAERLLLPGRSLELPSGG
jgi:diguanylate cyclase (GGDEF)-like protein/PAS domain S-box-containing protein